MAYSIRNFEELTFSVYVEEFLGFINDKKMDVEADYLSGRS